MPPSFAILPTDPHAQRARTSPLAAAEPGVETRETRFYGSAAASRPANAERPRWRRGWRFRWRPVRRGRGGSAFAKPGLQFRLLSGVAGGSFKAASCKGRSGRSRGFRFTEEALESRQQACLEMGTAEVAKKRTLPAWMTESRAKSAPKLAEVRTKRRKKVWTRTETVYCMNEAELVDAALCILAEKCKGRELETTSSEDEAQEPQQVVADPQWNSASRSDGAGARSPATGARTPTRLETSACNKQSRSDEDDDALKYVREIFFT